MGDAMEGRVLFTKTEQSERDEQDINGNIRNKIRKCTFCILVTMRVVC